MELINQNVKQKIRYLSFYHTSKSYRISEMKTVLQDLSNGETSLVDVPSPQSKSGHIIVESSKSLLSQLGLKKC